MKFIQKFKNIIGMKLYRKERREYLNRRRHKKRFKKCLKDIPVMAIGFLTIKYYNKDIDVFYDIICEL